MAPAGRSPPDPPPRASGKARTWPRREPCSGRLCVVDTCILLGLALLAGRPRVHRPRATSSRSAMALAALLRRRTRRWLHVWSSRSAPGCFNAVRAAAALARFDRARRAACGGHRAGPARCAAIAARPASSSPALVRRPSDDAHPGARAELGRRSHHVECEGRTLGRAFRARIYGGPEISARGDRSNRRESGARAALSQRRPRRSAPGGSPSRQ